MAKVKIQPNDNFAQAFRKFQRMVMDEGIIDQAKENQFFIPPSERRKMKKKELYKQNMRLRRRARRSRY